MTPTRIRLRNIYSIRPIPISMRRRATPVPKTRHIKTGTARHVERAGDGELQRMQRAGRQGGTLNQNEAGRRQRVEARSHGVCSRAEDKVLTIMGACDRLISHKHRAGWDCQCDLRRTNVAGIVTGLDPDRERVAGLSIGGRSPVVGCIKMLGVYGDAAFNCDVVDEDVVALHLVIVGQREADGLGNTRQTGIAIGRAADHHNRSVGIDKRLDGERPGGRAGIAGWIGDRQAVPDGGRRGNSRRLPLRRGFGAPALPRIDDVCDLNRHILPVDCQCNAAPEDVVGQIECKRQIIPRCNARPVLRAHSCHGRRLGIGKHGDRGWR